MSDDSLSSDARRGILGIVMIAQWVTAAVLAGRSGAPWACSVAGFIGAYGAGLGVIMNKQPVAGSLLAGVCTAIIFWLASVTAVGSDWCVYAAGVFGALGGSMMAVLADER
jgi:TM2 domain-containing membrane protein YozV